ncbi:siphovirus Gp157 family protein [Limosilactobacillus pontis]|uniref:siphovirus Gp157 family protein n=1 Tax=Limosilactobacillus pontis TaxID=35787 RepID=UPI002F269D3C
MNLFELGQQYQALADREDLDPTVLADTLDSIEDTWNSKANNIARWIESLDSDVDWLTKKKRSISDELSYRKNLQANLMTYLTSAIDDRGLKEAHTDDYILRPRNYKQRTIIDDENKVPAEFKHTNEVVAVDKTAVYKALKDGKDVPGAHLKPNRKTNIK